MPDILPTPVEGTVMRAVDGVWEASDPAALPAPAAVRAVGVSSLAATEGIVVNDLGFTLVATKAEHDETRARLNELLAALRAAGTLAP